MSDDVSARWTLPLLQPGQAQKEMAHNEALAVLDLLAHAAVLSASESSPPDHPAEGECWLIGDSPDGAWTGYAGHVAGWTTGGWRFVAPLDGMTLWAVAEGVHARRIEGAWLVGDLPVTRVTIAGDQVLGGREAAIADPVGGTIIDAESRIALTAILTALRAHGLIEN